jgi:hypothetical protein
MRGDEFIPQIESKKGLRFDSSSSCGRWPPCNEYALKMVDEGNRLHAACWVGMAIRVRVPDTCRVPDPTGTGTGTIFYPWVAPVPDPNRDGYEMGIFSHPWVTRRVLDTLLPL